VVSGLPTAEVAAYLLATRLVGSDTTAARILLRGLHPAAIVAVGQAVLIMAPESGRLGL
jgi:hypothetical protein